MKYIHYIHISIHTGESTTTVVTKIVFAGADDAAITGLSVWVYDGVADDPGTGTIGLLLRGVTPCMFAGVADATNTGVLAGLNAGVFMKVSND